MGDYNVWAYMYIRRGIGTHICTHMCAHASTSCIDVDVGKMRWQVEMVKFGCSMHKDTRLRAM